MIIRRSLPLFAFLLASFGVNGQHVLPPRLCCGTWKLERIQSVTGVQQQSPAVEFRLVLFPDGRMQQGLYPEGMVESQWQFDPVRMMLLVRDAMFQSSYMLRVVSLRRDALVLASDESGDRMMMYYTLKQ